jgi:formiminoglutamase
MGLVATSSDSNWPSARTLITPVITSGRRNVGLLGVPTYATSVTPRSSLSTPSAIRTALERFSTWSFSDGVDLAEHIGLVDYGDVDEPDGEGGFDRVRAAVASLDPSLELVVVLGGDNAATWHVLRAMCAQDYDGYGLVTLDAHLDLRDGQSNGSPVRQLLDDGLDAMHVAQVGLCDFSNSPHYAQRGAERGITMISRDELRSSPIEDAARRAVSVASEGGRRVYVDVDVDAADRSVAPGCPAAVPGGLSADEMRRFVRAVASEPSVVAIDVTEIDVARDSADARTVRLAALLVLEALAGVRRRIP